MNQNENQQNQKSATGVMAGINQEFKEREVAELASKLGLGYVDLKKLPINPDYLHIISKEDSFAGAVIPFFKVGKKLRVAFADPENEKLLEVLKDLANEGYELNKNLCSRESLVFAQKHYESSLHHEEQEIVAKVSDQELTDRTQAIADLKEVPELIKNSKSNVALNRLHEIVLRFEASDLHLEPKANLLKVRARIDGALSDLLELDLKTATNLIRQIKHESGLKFNITNMPQDGKYAFRTADRQVDVRVSTLPSSFGESVVMRFLDPKGGIIPLSQLGINAQFLSKLQAILQQKNGLILVTGPTGSGKTTTLHSALNYINSPDKKIITIEDPVEYVIEGIVQCEVKEDLGFTFAEGLHSILRQDPDVLMIGEIRDLETAETAVQASLTGHLVFATLHTNSAADAIPRLLNIGVNNFVLAPALRCIIAQRLVRKVCPDCKKLRDLSQSELEAMTKVVESLNARGETLAVPQKTVETVGCSTCANTGYKGRVVVAELLFLTEDLRQLIQKGLTSREIRELAQKTGMRTMWEEGIIKVMRGETTFEEVIKNIGYGQ
jgi:type II secretory ATPase GspE/PulE/Tfp pilus assembly ATPase PilB-like protein